MSIYRLLESEIGFPDPTLAEEDGLLAIGGDLSPERLLLAYRYGIFPWYNPEEEILWWCPKQRFLIFPKEIHISKSMKKFMKRESITVCFNRDFSDTVHRCRKMREDQEGTWISDEMELAYNELYKRKFAISVEAFENGTLAGGLYGVSIGRCFFGESMFSIRKNGSKAALIALAEILDKNGYLFIDCQFRTEHLERMGGRYVEWAEYDQMLAEGTGRNNGNT